jgi:DNA repair protein RadA/Sms
MAKSNSIFECQNCGASYPKWQGQCASCGQWNTLVETAAPVTSKSSGHGLKQKAIGKDSLVKFSEVELSDGSNQRFSSGVGELDRVLGGGIVAGAVILIGGEPGIGKSTLLTQVVLKLVGQANLNKKEAQPILYIAGEESPQQITLRIRRILETEQLKKTPSFASASVETIGQGLIFSTSTDVDEINSIIYREKPSLVVVDSIQTLTTDDLTGTAGSAGQVRESTDRLTETAKRLHVPMFLVGHVTKEGTIAGPKILEHIVDTVVELTGERGDDLRILRAVKNRFGATDEVGVFRMAEFGLAEVTNPSEIFLEHEGEQVPGSGTVCIVEGTRPLLLEVQALVVSSQLAMPRRVGRGIELSRIQVLAAVLQKHCRLPLGTSDIFLSAAGGFTVKEPAVDLGLAVTIASSLKNKALPVKTIFIGEVGLLGEIRSVNYLDRRIKEAKRLGYTKIISRKTHKYVREVLQELQLL